MLDHMTFRVSDIEKSKLFYSAALEPLGYKISYDIEDNGVRVIGFAMNGNTDTWIVDRKPAGGPAHIAWAARSKKEVDAFYKSAIAAGGIDNGQPGPRPEYDENYYGAFVLDPDGNNIEAVFKG